MTAESKPFYKRLNPFGKKDAKPAEAAGKPDSDAKPSVSAAAPEANRNDSEGVAVPKRNQPAVFTVPLTADAACKKAIKFVTLKDLQLVQPADCSTGQISTMPVINEFTINNNARRYIMSFISSNSQTEIRVKAMDKGSGFFSVNGGKTDGEKGEGVNAKGSAKFAAELKAALVQ